MSKWMIYYLIFYSINAVLVGHAVAYDRWWWAGLGSALCAFCLYFIIQEARR